MRFSIRTLGEFSIENKIGTVSLKARNQDEEYLHYLYTTYTIDILDLKNWFGFWGAQI